MASLNLGTDATRSTHIDTVQKRKYTTLSGSQRSLIPTPLGESLFNVLLENAKDLIVPEIRGKVESWTQQIREHEKSSDEVDQLVIDLTKHGIRSLKSNEEEIFKSLTRSIKKMTGVGTVLGVCPDCEGSLVLAQGKKGARFLKCTNLLCETSFPLPRKGSLTHIENESCRICMTAPLLVTSGYHNWVMCPVCWTREASSDHPWFCSECNRKDCPFSGSWEAVSSDESLGLCPDCNGETYLEIVNEKAQIICNSCKRVWKTPKLRQKMSITLGEACTNCNRKTLSIFKHGKKPYRLCVFCSLFYFDEHSESK